MAAKNKVLWTVRLPSIHNFLLQAQAAKVTAVAIRTTENNLSESIPAFHDAGMRVFGWRFPPIRKSVALDQAQHVVDLLQMGLDGFIADPEGHENPALNWDQPGLDDLAQEYCSIIRTAFPDRLFATTSDHRARRVFPNLPWTIFISHSDKVYPQAYWRMQTEDGPRPVGNGKPQPNYEVALSAWQEVGAAIGTIVPMAGEIALARPGEIEAYGAAAASNGIDELHFYTADDTVPAPIFQSIAAL